MNRANLCTSSVRHPSSFSQFYTPYVAYIYVKAAFDSVHKQNRIMKGTSTY